MVRSSRPEPEQIDSSEKSCMWFSMVSMNCCMLSGVMIGSLVCE